MKRLLLKGRTMALLIAVILLLGLFVYVALRSGSLAPVSVTVATVETQSITPSLFGVGTVEARYTYKIGPTFAGRIKRLDAHVGDIVKAGQTLGEMDPVDLDDRLRSQESALKRAQAALREAEARQAYAQTLAQRYEKAFEARAISEETIITKRQELQIANEALSSARESLAIARHDRDALKSQRNNLRLISPVDGVVTVRNDDPGTTIVAGQAVVEVIDPRSLWINVRFDQINASGLAAGLPAGIVLRSRKGQILQGRILRVEPKADVVTEETLAKVTFDKRPEPLPPVGELVEVTVALPELPAVPVIPNAAIRRDGGKVGVWQIEDGSLSFKQVRLGAADLDGRVQALDGLKNGDRVVVYSEKILTSRSRIKVVDHIPGISK